MPFALNPTLFPVIAKNTEFNFTDAPPLPAFSFGVKPRSVSGNHVFSQPLYSARNSVSALTRRGKRESHNARKVLGGLNLVARVIQIKVSQFCQISRMSQPLPTFTELQGPRAHAKFQRFVQLAQSLVGATALCYFRKQRFVDSGGLPILAKQLCKDSDF